MDKGSINGAIITDLSKAFDWILYDLLIAKPAAYDFEYQCFRIIESFLSNREQATKIKSAFSCYSAIMYGVPQESTPYFWISISVTYFLTIECEIASYADDNVPYNLILI